MPNISRQAALRTVPRADTDIGRVLSTSHHPFVSIYLQARTVLDRRSIRISSNHVSIPRLSPHRFPLVRFLCSRLIVFLHSVIPMGALPATGDHLNHNPVSIFHSVSYRLAILSPLFSTHRLVLFFHASFLKIRSGHVLFSSPAPRLTLPSHNGRRQGWLVALPHSILSTVALLSICHFQDSKMKVVHSPRATQSFCQLPLPLLILIF